MRFLLIALSMLTMGSLPRAPHDRPSRAADDEQALRRVEQEWAQAVVRRDTAVIARLLADEFFAVARSGDAPLESSDDGIRSVRVYGTTGTIMGVASRTSRDSTGARRTQRSNFLEVFVKRDGRWQAVAGHYFPVTDER